MSNTLATYTTKVQNEVDDTSDRAKSVIEQAIKDTYQEIIRLVGEKIIGTTEEPITATASQRYITPTNNFQDIKSVLWKNTSTDDYTLLERMTEEDYYKEYINRDSGDPTQYYRNGSSIYFDIAPSTAGSFKVSGFVVQSDLSGSTTSTIPDRFDQAVILGSVARFKAYEGLEDANEYFNLYRGPFFEQGKIGGILKYIMDELNSHQPVKRLKLWNK